LSTTWRISFSIFTAFGAIGSLTEGLSMVVQLQVVTANVGRVNVRIRHRTGPCRSREWVSSQIRTYAADESGSHQYDGEYGQNSNHSAVFEGAVTISPLAGLKSTIGDFKDTRSEKRMTSGLESPAR
jgi:hypothetical protein